MDNFFSINKEFEIQHKLASSFLISILSKYELCIFQFVNFYVTILMT
jgi:hypothetical protein